MLQSAQSTKPQTKSTQRPVQETAGQIHEAQMHTHELLSDLETRLDPVLTFEPESKGNGPIPVPGGESPLHSALLERRETADSINARLHKLIERLTV